MQHKISSIDASMCSRCDFLIFLIYTFRLSLLPGREATGAGSVRSAVGSYTLKRYWAGLEIKQHTFSMSAAASPDCNLNTYCFNLVSCHKAISPPAVTGSAIVLRQHRNLRKDDFTNFVLGICTVAWLPLFFFLATFLLFLAGFKFGHG